MNQSKTCLINKTCIPCQGGMPALTPNEIVKYLEELGGSWALNEKWHLTKAYKFKDFMDALTFANRIAEIAEKEGHHPELKISWEACDVEIWTHKIESLTESDFILAAKINFLNA